MPAYRSPLFSVVLSLFLLLMPSLSLAGSNVPLSIIAPAETGIGQPFLVRLSCPGLLAEPVVSWNGSEVRPTVTLEHGRSEAIALLGTRLRDEPGELFLEVRAVIDSQPVVARKPIAVVPHVYGKETLSVAPRMITPPEAVKERIDSERERMLAAIRTVSAGRKWQVPFSLPVKGKMLSRFGLYRVFNGSTKARHKGLDFRAWLGTPIHSIAAGKVVLVGDLYYAGNCVVIDHGEGVVSSSIHMSEVRVKEGDEVSCGQVIGLSGNTGRATGAHLHLSVYAQGMNIDPEPLFHIGEAATSTGPSRQAAEER